MIIPTSGGGRPGCPRAADRRRRRPSGEITGDSPSPERRVAVTNIYVRADGARLAVLVAALADGLLSFHIGATFPLADAALESSVTGRVAGATVLTLEGIS